MYWKDTPGERKRKKEADSLRNTVHSHQRDGWDGMGSGRLHLQASLGMKAESFFLFTNEYQRVDTGLGFGGEILDVSLSLLYLSNHLPGFEKKSKLAGRHWSKGLTSRRLNQSAIRALSIWNWEREP